MMDSPRGNKPRHVRIDLPLWRNLIVPKRRITCIYIPLAVLIFPNRRTTLYVLSSGAILGWFVHCILWFLSLHVQFRCHLIFWTTFVLCLIVFEGQIPHFCKFCRAMVCLGATCSFFSIFSCNILLLFVLRAFYIGNFDCDNCFRGVTEEFLDFFARFRVCIFCGKNQCAAPICTGSFWFICVFFYVCMQSRFWYVDITTLCKHWLPEFAHIIFSDQFFASPQLALFSCNVHVLPNIVIRPHFQIFFCCFTFPSCPQAPPHPSASIFTHLHPSVPVFASPPKTSCPGKFPRP